MAFGEILSLLINIAVGAYFIHFYPRYVHARLGAGRLPPAFGLLVKVLPPLGWVLIAGSLLYALLRTFGGMPA